MSLPELQCVCCRHFHEIRDCQVCDLWPLSVRLVSQSSRPPLPLGMAQAVGSAVPWCRVAGLSSVWLSLSESERQSVSLRRSNQHGHLLVLNNQHLHQERMEGTACQSSTRKLNIYWIAIAVMLNAKQTGGACFVWANLFFLLFHAATEEGNMFTVNRRWNGLCNIQFERAFMLCSFLSSLFCSSCVWRTSGHFSRCATTSSACATASCLTLSTSLMSGTSARWVKHNMDGCATFICPSKCLWRKRCHP